MPEIGNAFYTAATLNNIGRLYGDAGEHQKALDYLNQAVLLRRTIGDKNGEAATLYQFARVERDRGNLGEALNRIGAALTAVESLRINVKSQQLRASFFASVRMYNEFNIDLLERLHKQRPLEGLYIAALEASEKGRSRSLLELLTEATAEIREGVEPALLERERTLRQMISDKAGRQTRLLSGKHTEEQAAAAAREMAALATEYDQIQARIRDTSPRYAALTQPVPLNLKQIQSEVLDGETLLLEYALGEEKSFLWSVTQTWVKCFELAKREEIDRAARRVYELLIARTQSIAKETLEQRRERLDRADAEYPKAATALSHMLLGPVASELKKNRLLIVSDGVLQYSVCRAATRKCRCAHVVAKICNALGIGTGGAETGKCEREPAGKSWRCWPILFFPKMTRELRHPARAERQRLKELRLRLSYRPRNRGWQISRGYASAGRRLMRLPAWWERR